MLRRVGFTVLEASDGHAGVDLFRANAQRIDVVLLDLTLPGRTGREVLEEIRRLRPGVNVILTTAYSYETAIKTVGSQGSWRYLRKPYRINEVTELLRGVAHRAT
jgi:DNA-binding response OmpR family regulator